MTPEEMQTARDFDEGWSEDRIRNAEKSWGPGLVDVLPPDLAAKVQNRASREGTTDLDVIRNAVRSYLAGDLA